MKKFYNISNGYANGVPFEATLEEAILKSLKSTNCMCSCWLYEIGGNNIGRTRKVNYYDGYSFLTNDGNEYVRVGDKIKHIRTWK